MYLDRFRQRTSNSTVQRKLLPLLSADLDFFCRQNLLESDTCSLGDLAYDSPHEHLRNRLRIASHSLYGLHYAVLGLGNLRGSVLDAERLLVFDSAVEGVIAAVDGVAEVVSDDARIVQHAHLHRCSVELDWD